MTEYIGTAEPVGSSHVANAPGVQVSSATVRSEMVALERDGLPGAAPHQRRAHPDRQGLPLLRRPPDRARGARPDPAPAGERILRPGARRDGDHARAGHRPALRAHLLRRRGGRALPRHGHHPLGPGGRPRARSHALLVVVLSDGAVEKRTIDLDAEVVRRGAGPGRRACSTRTWSGARSPRLVRARQRRRRGRPGGGRGPGRLRARSEGSMESDQVFVGGPSRLAESFDAVETVRSVLGILEQQLVVVTLLRDVLDRGLSVAIGTEHGYEPCPRAPWWWRRCRRRAGPGRGRPARPDPHGLPAGAGRRARGGRAAGRAHGGSGGRGDDGRH